MSKRYGWFSNKQAPMTGISLYLNTKGEEVEVTQVSLTEALPSKYDDTVFVGEVTEFVRRKTKAKYEHELVTHDTRPPYGSKKGRH